MEQAIPAADGGAQAGVLYRNTGYANQENCVVAVEVLDDRPAPCYEHRLQDRPGPRRRRFANNDNCPAEPCDTLYIATGWEPETEGLYTPASPARSSDGIAGDRYPRGGHGVPGRA